MFFQYVSIYELARIHQKILRTPAFTESIPTFFISANKGHSIFLLEFRNLFFSLFYFLIRL
jgi:hypothetical protein